MRLNFTLFSLLLIGSLLYGQETFRKYYGEPYAFANEAGFSIECLAERNVLIGTRENSATLSTDIAFWFFDPVTNVLLDSTVLAQPENQRLLATYAGPDGGFLILYKRIEFSNATDVEFAYFGADGDLAWENSLPESVIELDFDGIRDVSFVSSTELVLTYGVLGQGADLTSRIGYFSATEGLTGEVTYGEPGSQDIWSVERQLNGDLLIAGTNIDGVFVALLADDGTVKWDSRFDDVEGSFGSERYDYLSDAHRSLTDTVVLVTGKLPTGRAIIVMDTLGNRLEEYTVEDSFLGDEKEDAVWFGKELLVVNNATENFFVWVPLTNYEPEFEIAEGSGSAQGYRLFGSKYDAEQGVIFSAARGSDVDDDAALIRFDPVTLAMSIQDIGTAGLPSTELAVGLSARPDGGFLLQMTDPGTFNRSFPAFIYTDSVGNVTNKIVLNGNTGNSKPTITETDAGDFLVVTPSFRRWDIRKYDAAGAALWNTSISGVFASRNLAMVSLPEDKYAVRDFRQELDPDFNLILTTNMYVSDASGVVSDTVGTARLNGSVITVGSNNDLVFAGNSQRTDSMIVISKDIAANTENWVFTETFAGSQRITVPDIVTLPDGSYGMLVSVLYNSVVDPALDLHYLHLSNTGEELGRLDVARDLQELHTPVLRVSEAGFVTIAYGAGTANPDDAELTDYTLEVKRVALATTTLSLETAFMSPFSLTAPADIEHLADGRTAIIADAEASDTSRSADVLLLVFDAEGNITNLQGRRQLDVQLTVSPNPTVDRILVSLEALPVTPLDFLLYDATGRQLQQGRLTGTQTTVELGQYPAGSYFLLLRNQAGELLSRQVVRQ